MATRAQHRFLTADEFAQVDLGPDVKAELDNGVIRLMAGGSREHSRVQMNLYAWFRQALRGSPCRPYGSDQGIRTSDWSVRFPDLTVDCGPDGGAAGEAGEQFLAAPRVIFEVLSPSTRHIDLGPKLIEYRQVFGVEMIVFVDPVAQTLHVFTRGGAQGHWEEYQPGEPIDLEIRSLGLTLPHAEIFARD